MVWIFIEYKYKLEINSMKFLTENNNSTKAAPGINDIVEAL